MTTKKEITERTLTCLMSCKSKMIVIKPDEAATVYVSQNFEAIKTSVQITHVNGNEINYLNKKEVYLAPGENTLNLALISAYPDTNYCSKTQITINMERSKHYYFEVAETKDRNIKELTMLEKETKKVIFKSTLNFTFTLYN